MDQTSARAGTLSSPYIEVADARTLPRLATELAARHATLRLAEAHVAVGPIPRRPSVAKTMESFRNTTAA